MEMLLLAEEERPRLDALARGLGSPYADLEGFLASAYSIWATLPREVLARLLAFRSDPAAPGVLLLKNFPIDEVIPPTPLDSRRSLQKHTFVSEASLLGVAQILGEPLAYRAEKDGDLPQNLSPVKSEVQATSSESSEIDLGFHTDFSFDQEHPDRPYDFYNADFILLICLRQDRTGEAYTLYADARDICKQLSRAQRHLLRQPLFQFGASYSFTGGECGAEKPWSMPVPVLKGPEEFPEISVDLLCGTRGVNEESEALLEVLREICSRPEVTSKVCLEPGDVLLINNRKGAHARTAFQALHDGKDRWLQRVYARRSLWELRQNDSGSQRVF